MAKVKTGPKVKRKGGGVAAKAQKVGQLQEDVASASAIVVTEYRGLRVGDLQELRRKLRPRGVEYQVVKNSLFARAAEAAGRAAMRPLLSGPTAVAFPAKGGKADEVEVARALVDELRTFRALKIVGGVIGPRVYSAEEVQILARLPSRPQLQATIVGSIQAPLGNLTGTLSAPFSQLIRVFAARGSAA
ncbi:MAG: 50S ribosomal protein L10 [Chloroflexota bacterium]|nr:50S ribosomal protein L10 [Chloroflexota bacterium]MDE3103500.1 50S ribosomal protein L10 [Chloroflexota bacterium]